jgi:hypothetical protein
MPTAASSASATCCPDTRQPPGSGGVAGESRRGREPTASSSSRRPEFLDRLADLVPPPRKHRHRYHGVFAPNHKLRRAVTALAVGNIGFFARSRGWRACGPQTTHGRLLLRHTPKASVARHLPDCVGEADGPGGGGVSAQVPELWRRHPSDRLTPKPGPIRKILTHLGEPLEPQAAGRHRRWEKPRSRTRGPAASSSSRCLSSSTGLRI